VDWWQKGGSSRIGIPSNPSHARVPVNGAHKNAFSEIPMHDSYNEPVKQCEGRLFI